MNILLNLDFDKRCMKLTAVIGVFAAVLCVTAPVCRCCELPITVRQFLALLGSLSACGMLSLCAVMTEGALTKAFPWKAIPIRRTADTASQLLKLFFLVATCSGGEGIACAALMLDVIIIRFVFPQTRFEKRESFSGALPPNPRLGAIAPKNPGSLRVSPAGLRKENT